jgi:prepilin-type N-terminal cleavage/methylation domain
MKKGFTLLELLIVIGILAILSTTMLLVINPAEMLRKARDSQRISDLNNLKSALSLYLTDVANPSLAPADNTAYISNNVSNALSQATACIPSGYSATSSNSVAINGTGWIPVNFASISGGSPISAEPVDPNPSTTGSYRFYLYIPSRANNTFELMAKWKVYIIVPVRQVLKLMMVVLCLMYMKLVLNCLLLNINELLWWRSIIKVKNMAHNVLC